MALQPRGVDPTAPRGVFRYPLRSKNSNRAIHKDLQDKRKVARGLEP
jgi:hypothetical protein